MKNRFIYILLFSFLSAFSMQLFAEGEKDFYLIQPDSIELSAKAEMKNSTFERTEKRLLGRFDRGIVDHLFMPKGSWMFGLTVSYLTFDSQESQLLSLLKDFDCTAYTVQVNPFFAYIFKDNIAAGIRFTYGRTFGRIDNLQIDFGDDLDFSINDFFYQQQMYTGTGFIRTYIGLSANKRFGLFNETSISFGGGTSKYVTGKGESLNGTYTEIRKLNVGMKPGLTVFVMNNAAVDVSLGVAGFNYRKETQITNQVEEGSTRQSGANFKINLFNINIGIIVCI